MKKIFVVLFIFVHINIYSLRAEKDIEEKLELVLNELKKDEIKPFELPQFLKDFILFLGKGGSFFQFIFFVLIAAALLFLVYKIIGFFMPDKIIGKSSKKIKVLQKTEDSTELSDQQRYLEDAKKMVENGDISSAIIYLHLGSVNFLINNKTLLKNRDYTNREIFRMIKKELKFIRLEKAIL